MGYLFHTFHSLCNQSNLQLYVNCNLNDRTLLYLKLLSLPTYIAAPASTRLSFLTAHCKTLPLHSRPLQPKVFDTVNWPWLGSTLRMLLRHPSKKSVYPPTGKTFPPLAATIFNGYKRESQCATKCAGNLDTTWFELDARRMVEYHEGTKACIMIT